MDYQLKVNEQENPLCIQLDKEGKETWNAVIGEHSYTMTCKRLDAYHLYAEINGKGVHLFVSSEGSVKKVAIDGVVYSVEDATKRQRKRTQKSKGDVTPPMPGAIMRILVKEGDIVDEGQELLVMSAMKMETTLYAPHSAVVKRVLVEEAEQVEAGQQLFELDVLSTDKEGSVA